MLKAVRYRLSEVPQRYWDFAQEYGTIYQTKPYLECLEACGVKLIVVVVVEGEEVIGGAGVIVNREFLKFPVSAGTFFGPVVGDMSRFADVFHCFTDMIKSAYLIFGITVLPEHAEVIKTSCDLSGWICDEYELLRWDISGSVEDMIKQLPKGKKAAIKRARREGVLVEEICDLEQVREFYRLHSLSMKRGDVVALPLAIYENIMSLLRPNGLAAGFLALHPTTKQPIASVMLLLGTYGEAIYMSVGQDYEFRALGATDLLMLQCVEFLKSKGYLTLNMLGLVKGDSPRAKGIRDWKLSWAGDNGRRCPSFVLIRYSFGIKSVKKAAFFLKKVAATLKFSAKSQG